MAVTDEAISKIRNMIASGEIKPGQRLPREADLAVRLGLSRSSLREAVRALELVRILDVRHGDGTYVTSLSSDALLDAVGFIIDFLHDTSVLEFLELRRILEPAASARAAIRIDDIGLAELEEVLARVTENSSVDELVDSDLMFHRRIAAAAGNSVLSSLIESLSGPTHRVRTWRGLTQQDALARTLREHDAIFRAIRNRDADLARNWTAVHIAGVEEWLRSTLQPPNESGGPTQKGTS